MIQTNTELLIYVRLLYCFSRCCRRLQGLSVLPYKKGNNVELIVSCKVIGKVTVGDMLYARILW